MHRGGGDFVDWVDSLGVLSRSLPSHTNEEYFNFCFMPCDPLSSFQILLKEIESPIALVWINSQVKIIILDLLTN